MVLEIAALKDPNNLTIAMDLGKTLIDLGSEEAAYFRFQKLFARDPDNLPAHEYLLRYQQEKGDVEGIKFHQQAIERIAAKKKK